MSQICKYCPNWATHEDSVPDASVPGINPSECGYKTVYYCDLHAAIVRRDVGNTSRVKPIEVQP